MENFHTPILFIIFNRPNETLQVFNKIRQVRPKYLFVAADGPRENKVDDFQRCENTRNVLKNVDWNCEVMTLFNDQNLGCGKAVSSAIKWFFTNVPEGIILEDDCLPHPDFFKFCETLLEKYRYELRIMHIGGRNNLPDSINIKYSYYYSAYNHIWGWATWKRAWDLYQYRIVNLDDFIKKKALSSYFNKNSVKLFWEKIFIDFNNNPIDTWDYQWTYTIWKNKGLSILPVSNLIKNIGFNNEATHTKFDPNIIVHEFKSIQFPLKHPKIISINYKTDHQYNEREICKTPTFIGKIKLTTKSYFFKLKKLIQ